MMPRVELKQGGTAATLYGAPERLKNGLVNLGSQFRGRRHAIVMDWLQSLALPEPYKILDLGGTPDYWKYFGLPPGAEIVCVNIDGKQSSQTAGVSVVWGDATSLVNYADQSFDVVFSNSLIEHLYTFERQRQLSREIRRVGKHYFVQTPNRRFFIEPHFYRVPLWQFLPYAMRLYLLKRYKCGFCGPVADAVKAADILAEIRLCDGADLKELFPNSRLVGEQAGPFVKSWMVFSQ